MTTEKYIPSGDIQGDTSNLPDRGTKTGFLSSDYGGIDFSGDCTQSQGAFSAGSDPVSDKRCMDPMQTTAGTPSGEDACGCMEDFHG